MTKMLAIDPGGVHVGMAWFHDEACFHAEEMTPAGCIAEVQRQLSQGLLDVLVIEKFQLYPWMAQNQAFSEFPTVELIGALKLLWATCGGEVWDDDPGDRRTALLVMQGANIKDPTRRILRAKGVKSVAKKLGAGGHAADAELHGYHHVMRLDPGN